jgi:dipeptidyl aminopeptidase/acylaminoacyl peptidase
MKTKINTLVRAVLCLLITFGLAHHAGAQDERIVFDAPVTAKTKNVTTTTTEIFSMNQDGTGTMRLTSGGGFSPRWSPDRQHIAFFVSGASGIIVNVMDAIGQFNGGRTFAVAGPAKSTGLDWSPDGSTIWFTGYPTGQMDSGLWAVTVNGTTGEAGPQILIRPGVCHWPACSPDGTKIAFAEDTDGTGIGSVIVLKILDLTTGGEITCDLVPSGQASWSPTGNRIAFAAVVTVTTTARSGKQTTNHYQEIFVGNADLSGITQVTNLKSISTVPTWNPAGTELLFASQVSGAYSIYKVALNTGAVTLLRSEANHPDWAP